ncbi:hypothetical protein GQX73_g4901 [Xylaria multiplex]|uniref:DUF676 domain-containing protein n=1 Tax=Xylaria multiplex TaxID=323545 RepID=A0A7C8MT14_9PEZI|nr:hypothetical protein GQX73_g4901 [Xylaria multiplex]
MSNLSSNVAQVAQESEEQANSALSQAPSSSETPECWQRATVFDSFIVVLDYHLCPSAQAAPGKPPSKLHWPMKEQNPSLSNASIYNFKYRAPCPASISDLLNPDKLEAHAHDLLRLINNISNSNNKASRIILVGYGYGGLITEWATVLAGRSKSNPSDITLSQIIGVVLFGTPHFPVGLIQWAIICGKKPHNEERSKGIVTTAKYRGWKSYEKEIDILIEKQGEFCSVCASSDTDIKILCCFADWAESSGESSQVSATHISLPTEWCLLSGFSATHIHSTYTQLTTFSEDVDYSGVSKIVERWLPRAENPEASNSEEIAKARQSLRSILEGSNLVRRGNAPGRNWTYPLGNLDSITVGAIITKNGQTIQLLASATVVDPTGVCKVSKKMKRDDRVLYTPTTSNQAATIGHHESSLSPETEQLTRESVLNYAKKAAQLPNVNQLMKSTDTVYLVVGTETEHGANDPKGKATSPSLGADSHVKGLQLRLLKFASRAKESQRGEIA